MTSISSSAATSVRDGPAPAQRPPLTRSPWYSGLRAVIYREFLLLTRNRTNLLLALLPTAIYLLLFSTSLTRLVGNVRYQGILVSYPEFTIPAIMLSSMLSASATTGTSLFQEEVGGMAVELWSYPLSRTSYITGKILASTALVLAQSVAALLLGVLLFDLRWPASHWLALALGTVAASLTFNGLFLLLASFVHDFQRFMVVINVVGPLLLFASPSFYPAQQMPPPLRWISMFNPVTYGIRCLRDGAIFGLGATWPIALGLLASATGLFAVIAIVLTRRAGEL
jgi:ABC-2 type transport system permease protein